MQFDVEIVLKERDSAVTERIEITHGAPASWDEGAVYDLLVEVLRAIERAHNPGAARDRAVKLTGFSWIVEPADDKVILAIEIPMGAAVAGPFDIPQARLDSLVASVIRLERQGSQSQVVH
jgi:hypothetical protein